MIKIFCLYFQALDEVYKKPMYSPDYVEKLYNGFKKHCKVDFEFICYSDTPVKADKVIPLPKDSNIKRHWHKLKFFDKEFTGEGDIIVLDIDQVIVNDITEMVNYPVSDNELVSYEKWWTTNKENIPINGGWYKFKAGSLKFVHDKYMKNPEKWQTHYFNNRTVHYKYYGEQNFVYDTCVENDTKITRMPGKWISKYDKDPDKNLRYNKMYMDSFDEPYMILGEGVNENIKIVHFANVWNNIHDNKEAWVKDNWQ